MARQRNNVARLPAEARLRVAELLLDGAEYDAIRADSEVAEACRANSIELHNSSLLAYQQSIEYHEYRKMRLRYQEELERRKLAALFVSNSGGADAVANVATFELLRIALEKLSAGSELDGRELSAISGALAAYQRNRINERREDSERAAARREAELLARINELETQLAAQNGRRGLTRETLEEIEQQMEIM